MFPRRRFLLNSVALAAGQTLPAKLLAAQTPVAKTLPPWKPGVLEIHQIATNRGNSALLLLPDGTTMMVDAGAIYGSTPYLTDPLPSAQRRPGEWIGRYAKRRLQAAGLTSVKQENRIANKKTDDLKSRAGHIVLRVEPGCWSFAVHIVSNADESDTVTSSFGPYTC